MNERIKELAEQAYRLAVLASESELHKCKIGSDYFNLLEKEKFAELIVRECADYVQFYYKDHMCEIIANDMKQHFGVEL